MRKILNFALFGALGGILGAAVGEGLFKASMNLPFLGSSGKVSVWTATVSLFISLALVIAQNRYLKRKIVSVRQLILVVFGGVVTGTAAGLAGQALFELAISTFANSLAGLDGLANLTGWLILGGVLGWGMGFFIPNLPSVRSTVAGLLGGIAASWIRLEIEHLHLGTDLIDGVFGRIASAAVLGMFLGLVIAVVEATFREAWIDILYGSEKEKRTVLLGDNPITIGSSPECTVFVHGAQPVALRYKLDHGNVSSEELATGRISLCRPGDSATLKNVTIRIGASGGKAGSAGNPSATKITYALQMNSGVSLQLTKNLILTSNDFPKLDIARGPIAEIAENPKVPGQMGLKNLTNRAWAATLASGEKRQIDPGRSVVLGHGNRIDFGGANGEILQRRETTKSSGRTRSGLTFALATMVIIAGIASRIWVIASNHRTEIAATPDPVKIAPPSSFNEPEKVEEAVMPVVKIPEPPAPPPIDPTPRIAVTFMEDGRFGIKTIDGNPADPTDDAKKLTFSENGSTNNTRVWIDGDVPVFGGKDGTLLRPMSKVTGTRFECDWKCKDIDVIQIVELVGGEVSRRTDTVRVDYQIENRGNTPRTVGLRFLLDSLIGANDGVPFIVPGVRDIVKTPQSYVGQETPHFIQALEFPDLDAAGVVAYVGLRPGREERPSEVVLAHWPGFDAGWTYDRSSALSNDSSVGIYYQPQALAPGAVRKLAFTYGLGSLSSSKTTNAKLSLTTGGPFRSGGEFYVVALVQSPKSGQKVVLTLPAGLTVKGGSSLEKLVPYGDEYAQLSWLVRIDDSFFGEAEVKAKLEPEDVEERVKYLVQPRDARLILKTQNPPLRVGKRFSVSVLVQNPRQGQMVELKLPAGFSLVSGNQAKKEVPTETGSARHSQVDWWLQTFQPMSGEIAVSLSPDGIEDKVQVNVERTIIIE